MPTSMTLPTFCPRPLQFRLPLCHHLGGAAVGLDGGFEPAEEAYITASLLKKYQPLQLQFHQGVILPIGEEPSGRSWTGFQSTVSGTQGYLVVYREDNEQPRGTIDTWLPEGKKVTFTPVMGSGKKFAAKVGAQGRVSFELNDKNSFTLYQYEIKP